MKAIIEIRRKWRTTLNFSWTRTFSKGEGGGSYRRLTTMIWLTYAILVVAPLYYPFEEMMIDLF
jgi:hypothetical protein